VSRLALLSITRNCINRGNLIIEYATRRALGIDKFALELDAHSEIDDCSLKQLDETAGLVLPGATLLEPGDHAAFASLAHLQRPVIALGVALRSRENLSNLSIARWLHGARPRRVPIGSRDPFTHRALDSVGIESRLVGCQTLLLGRAERWSHCEGPIVFCPGLGYQPSIAACALACAMVGETVVLLHAPSVQPAMVEHRRLSVMNLDSAESAFELFRRASVVVTGRIHACLSCIVLGVPFLFLGPWFDTRYSLLEFLDIPLEPPVPRRIERLVGELRQGRSPRSRCLERAEELRRSMFAYVDSIGEAFGVQSVMGTWRGRGLG